MDFFAAVLWARAKPWIGYAIAIVGPLLGMLVRSAEGQSLAGFPFITFFPGILLAAMTGGLACGGISIVITALLADYYFISPHDSLAWPQGLVPMVTFLLVSFIMVGLVDAAAKTGERLNRASQQLRMLNEELEARVADRTRELTLATARLREEIRIKELAETQVRQMQKIEAVGQLTGGIAHDFNNMLAIIMGSLEMAARRRAQGRGDVDRLLDNAMEGAKRAATLTHQLLAFSRQQPLAPAVADISGIVSNMADILRRTLGETVNLESALSPGVWRTKVDPGQLESAILNLAVNARDAMPDGGRLTIETQNACIDEADAAAELDVAPGQYVLITLTDTGTGMPEDIIARAFDPFFTTKPAGRGTGLGLAQVYGFIKQSNGHVKIYSEPGVGTSVKIYLPRYVGPEEPAEPPPVTSAPPAGSPEETVLLVEDDEAVRLVHLNMLRGLNYTVVHAASGEEALNILQTQPQISLLFTDVVMPTMSGQQLATQAKTIRPELKILYTTGYTANAIVHDGIIDPDVDLLQKPFTYTTLAHKLRLVLDKNSRLGLGG